MGVIQPCCFEDKRGNRNNGLIRLTNKKQIIDNTSNILKNYQKSKRKQFNKKNIVNISDHSNIQLTEMTCENNSISKKETPNKKKKNKLNIDIDDKKDRYSFNGSNKRKKNRNASMDTSNPVMRKRLSNINDEKSKSAKINTFHKKNILEGSLIEKGKFGNINTGLFISSGQVVVIKTYNNISDGLKNRVVKSLDILYKLNHKILIKPIQLPYEELFDDNNNLKIAYENNNLDNVEELISKFGSLDEKIIQIYIRQLLEGLKYLHENKIYHKNLKPNNIFVDSDGTIQIYDYIIDNLLIENTGNIYEYLLNSENINYYIPPFFIQKFKEQNNTNESTDKLYDNNCQNIFNDWQSYDLWFLGCLIIEVFSRKKPWSYYNVNNNSELFDFLRSTHLTPTIPQKMSLQCQELIKILFNYSLTMKPNIYDILFNLDYFKLDTNDFTYNNNTNNKNTEIKSSFNDSQGNCPQSDDSINDSGMQLGKVLANNKVVNLLNNNSSFSVSYTVEDNNSSLSQSQTIINNKLRESLNNKLNQSSISKGKNLNNININTPKNMMPKVEEAQIEQSPDPVKDDDGKNFNFSKQ